MGKGFLQVELFVGDHALPVAGMSVLVKANGGSVLYALVSDENGLTQTVSLEAPDKTVSLDHNYTDPVFAVYDVEVPAAKGFHAVSVHDTQVFDTVTSVLPVQLHPDVSGRLPVEELDDIVIPKEHGVDFKRDMMPIETSAQNEAPAQAVAALSEPPGTASLSNPIPLANEVVIPDYITVHLGSPNATATNVTVPFKDYIKNVASSEIFPTWEPAAIEANIYAQISFALNRVYT